MALANLKQVSDFFKDEDYNLAKFRADWAELPDKDKEQIRQGIGDGSLTY